MVTNKFVTIFKIHNKKIDNTFLQFDKLFTLKRKQINLQEHF